MSEHESAFSVQEVIPSEPTVVDGINSLLEDYKRLLVEKRRSKKFFFSLTYLIS
jgi:hypothetical protein